MKKWTLGLSAYYHDSAAALVCDGQIIAAAQEERFSREKNDARFPSRAIVACLNQAQIGFDDIDQVVFYDKPLLKFERLLETYLDFAPRGWRSFSKAMPIWIKEKLFLKSEIIQNLQSLEAASSHSLPHEGTKTARYWRDRLLFSEHHLSHAASAFYPSPFKEALILTMDGVGEWATTSVAFGRDTEIKILKELHFPHSLGLLYSAFTGYLGFKVNSGEYKVMGLAPYGQPRFANTIRDHLLDLKEDGSFRLNLDYFDYCTGFRMYNERFVRLFGEPPREKEARLSQFHMDVAASIQQVTEGVVLSLGRALAKETGQKNLCLAGGVALNCVANGKLLREGCFEKIWIQPAAGDAGGALGAALVGSHLFHGQPRRVESSRDGMSGSFLGQAFTQEQIESALTKLHARFEVLNENDLLCASVDALAEGQALGWFQGRMEFGPRALGARSIIADARSPKMQSLLNLKIKYRESFRPFAPSVLSQDVEEWFDFAGDSPYMLLTADIKSNRRIPMTLDQQKLFGIEKLNVARSEIPAVTHVDYSARLQTVHGDTNPLYHRLLEAFKAKTGCPILVNTSFNVRGEPIVASPEDAFRCFMGTELDMLVIGRCLMRKKEQTAETRHYHSRFELD